MTDTVKRQREMVDRILEGIDRPKMLDKPLAVYEHDFSRHPDRLRVSFSDGSTAVYDIRRDQPAPVILENIRIIRKWKQEYVNKPRRRRCRK